MSVTDTLFSDKIAMFYPPKKDVVGPQSQSLQQARISPYPTLFSVARDLISSFPESIRGQFFSPPHSSERQTRQKLNNKPDPGATFAAVAQAGTGKRTGEKDGFLAPPHFFKVKKKEIFRWDHAAVLYFSGRRLKGADSSPPPLLLIFQGTFHRRKRQQLWSRQTWAKPFFRL